MSDFFLAMIASWEKYVSYDQVLSQPILAMNGSISLNMPNISETSQIRGGDRKSDNIHDMRDDCRATEISSLAHFHHSFSSLSTCEKDNSCR